MICPYCAANRDKVIDSRSSEGGLCIRRRRECCDCSRRFTTYERVERTARLMVVKRDGTRVAFDPDNILRGIQAACGKRPISEERKIEVVRVVEDEIHRRFDREVPSTEIGRCVAEHLRNVDEIAYIRFASEYYNFGTIAEFKEELAQLQDRPPRRPDEPELFGDVDG
ncbi:MAG: transcriptional repressor NrdR [Phycisphaerales bacterium]|nr:transcriptional repressor NrdR [Phycisphaerales bacterium]